MLPEYVLPEGGDWIVKECSPDGGNQCERGDIGDGTIIYVGSRSYDDGYIDTLFMANSQKSAYLHQIESAYRGNYVDDLVAQ